jgi:hypothetical protein
MNHAKSVAVRAYLLVREAVLWIRNDFFRIRILLFGWFRIRILNLDW